MSALREFERLLPQMTPAERTQALQMLVRDLGNAFPGIESIPNVNGGDACIVRTRIPVWLLVQARAAGVSEAEILLDYPSLRAEDLANAWAYYRERRDEIERQIAEHENA